MMRMENFEPSRDFVAAVMTRIERAERRAGGWGLPLRPDLLRLAVTASALLGSILAANPCH